MIVLEIITVISTELEQLECLCSENIPIHPMTNPYCIHSYRIPSIQSQKYVVGMYFIIKNPQI